MKLPLRRTLVLLE